MLFVRRLGKAQDALNSVLKRSGAEISYSYPSDRRCICTHIALSMALISAS